MEQCFELFNKVFYLKLQRSVCDMANEKAGTYRLLCHSKLRYERTLLGGKNTMNPSYISIWYDSDLDYQNKTIKISYVFH